MAVVHIGDYFTRLKVICEVGKRNGQKRWFCECNCGNTVEVSKDYNLDGPLKKRY